MLANIINHQHFILEQNPKEDIDLRNMVFDPGFSPNKRRGERKVKYRESRRHEEAA